MGTDTTTDLPALRPADWSGEIERVATYLYRDEHHWSAADDWQALPEAVRQTYVNRAQSVGYMLNFPNHTEIVRQWDRLCPCDGNPETTQGPERDCPIHGEMPYAVVRLDQQAADLERLRARVAELEAGETHTEWGAKWADGGYCPSTPATSEEYARKHARTFGTRPIRHEVGPWVYADTGESVFPWVPVEDEAEDNPFGTTCIDCGEAIDDVRPYGATTSGDLIHADCGDPLAVEDEAGA